MSDDEKDAEVVDRLCPDPAREARIKVRARDGVTPSGQVGGLDDEKIDAAPVRAAQTRTLGSKINIRWFAFESAT